MSDIKIFTDCVSDLSKELIEENDIATIPFYVHFNDEIYKDGIELNQEELYKKVKQYNTLPKTSAPSPQDFINSFNPYVEEKKEIIYIGISHKLSATMQNAIIAKNEFPNANISLIDSCNLSSGIGLLALKACDLRNEGLSGKQIVERLNELTPKIQTSFVVDTLEYLHKGGRCSALESFFGGLLKIKPILKVEDGKIKLGKKARGKTDKVINLMLEDVLKNKNNIDKKRVFITHSQGGELVYYLKEQLEKNTDIENVYITEASSVISSHCGPGTIGILYMEK